MVIKQSGKIMELIYNGIIPIDYCKFQQHQLQLRMM